jgi:small-conductance mechanosensitive channel
MQRIGESLSAIHFDTSWLPQWSLSMGLAAILILLALWLHRAVFAVLERWVSGQDLLRRSLLSRTKGPSRLALVMGAIAVAFSIAPLSDTEVLRKLMLVGVVILIGWISTIALHVWMVVYLRRFKLDSEDNLLARKHVTQSRILERVARILIVMLTLAIALMTFDNVRQYGISLLASAGVVGVVMGLALQPMLKNLIAGVQLAITQPIRIDDALLIENEWGNVEEITSSYVVIRLWDWRRLIVPLSYFIERPFQNWTRESSALIGTVFLYVDFTVPVAELRAELERIVCASPLWDGRVVALQVTELKERTMEIRILVSASTAGRTFDLRCEVREKMIAYVQKRHPEALPRLRTDLRDARSAVAEAAPH